MKKKIYIISAIILILSVLISSFFLNKYIEKVNYTPKNESVEIELLYSGEIITITDIKEVGTIENILLYSKKAGDMCEGVTTHKITLGKDAFYLKADCGELIYPISSMPYKLSKKNVETIEKIIENNIHNASLSKEKIIEMFNLKNPDKIAIDSVSAKDGAYNLAGVVIYTTENKVHFAFIDKDGFSQECSLDAILSSDYNLTYLENGKITLKLQNKENTVYDCFLTYSKDGSNVYFKAEDDLS